MGGGEITARNPVKYLGVLLDNVRRYFLHLKQVCDKAERFVGAIRSLLPKVNGPTDTARKLYYSVWESVVLYAAPIWASTLGMEKNRKILVSAQRTALVRTLTAYRTVSHGALCVVMGRMLIHIKSRHRWKKYGAKKDFGVNRQGRAYDLMEELQSLKQEAEDRWSIEWTFHNPGN